MAILSLQRISEQAQEGKAPEEMEMEMETLSLPGWAAPTLAGTLTPPEGTEPRRTGELRLLQACTLEIRDLL